MILLSIPLFYVERAAAAQAFYCHQLGFHLEFAHRLDPLKDDPCYMGISRDGIWLHISSYSGDGVPGSVANLIVDNIDEIYAEYAKQGLQIDTPPTDQPWGSREMYIKDPEGNSLRYIQPKSLEPETEETPQEESNSTKIEVADWN